MTDEDGRAKAETGSADAPPLYRDKRTARFAAGERVKDFLAFEQRAKKRLLILREAVSRNGLMLLPSNRFEALSGERQGRFSIGINQQWRICFEWPDGRDMPFNIEITDYH